MASTGDQKLQLQMARNLDIPKTGNVACATRPRSSSSISMSDIPSHMSSGQILYSTPTGSPLPARCKKMTAMEYLIYLEKRDQEDAKNEPDSPALASNAQPSPGFYLSPNTCDRLLESKAGSNIQQKHNLDSESSDDDDDVFGKGGGVSIREDLEKDEFGNPKLCRFPQFNTTLSTALLSVPELPLEQQIPLRSTTRTRARTNAITPDEEAAAYLRESLTPFLRSGTISEIPTTPFMTSVSNSGIPATPSKGSALVSSKEQITPSRKSSQATASSSSSQTGEQGVLHREPNNGIAISEQWTVLDEASTIGEERNGDEEKIEDGEGGMEEEDGVML